MDIAIEMLLKRQDRMITRQQALQLMTQAEITARLGRYWQVILPGVYAAFTGALTGSQTCRAALLHAGEGAMLNDLAALRAYRMPNLPPDPLTRVLVADTVQVSSRDFVVVRRTTRLPQPVTIAGLPVAPIGRALCEFAARHSEQRDAFAVVACAVQERRVSITRLIEETERGPTRGRPRLVRILERLEAGVRSVPEDDFRVLVQGSAVLPEPMWNPLLELQDGRKISPDALFKDSGLVHETNGRKYHGGFDDFDDMQERSDALVTAGLTVLHNAPRRIRDEGQDVIAQVEKCHLRLAGQGLPVGVVLLRPGPPNDVAS
jgi:hypothetical protein